MLRIATLATLITLGASVHAAGAGSFATDLPRISFPSGDSTGPATPELPTRDCTAPFAACAARG